MVEIYEAVVVKGIVSPQMIITRCDTCMKTTVAASEPECLEYGWREVEHGIECPTCTQEEAARALRDEEAGVADVVGQFALTGALIGRTVEVDPAAEAAARHALEHGAVGLDIRPEHMVDLPSLAQNLLPEPPNEKLANTSPR
jgi:hypothetical protein